MDTRNIDFEIVTLKKIKEFLTGLSVLQEKYPDITFQQMRDYIKNGTKAENTSQDLYDRIDHLQEVRKSAITNEMRHAASMAVVKNKKIPEKYLKGESLAPLFHPDIYSFSTSFGVYDFVRWYSEEELLDYDLDAPDMIVQGVSVD